MNSNGNGNLTAADLAMFSRLGIPVELLSQAHIERVTDRDAREKYGIKGAGDMGGIVFPYINPAEGRRWTGLDECLIAAPLRAGRQSSALAMG